MDMETARETSTPLPGEEEKEKEDAGGDGEEKVIGPICHRLGFLFWPLKLKK